MSWIALSMLGLIYKSICLLFWHSGMKDFVKWSRRCEVGDGSFQTWLTK